MNQIFNNLSDLLQNEVTFFAIVVPGIAFVGLVGIWLVRELRGGKAVPKPRHDSHGAGAGPTATSPDAAGLSGYRGSAGATRTMDSSPSGILGRLQRPGTRGAPTGGTSIISGSHVGPALGSSDRDRQQIEPELRQAGYYRPTALAEYKSVRALLVLLPLVLAAAIALLVEPARMPAVVVGGLIASGLGYSIPRLYVNYIARYRRREIERGLPAALDMIVLGLVAGQNVMNSFQRVTHEIRRSFPILAEEMGLAYRQAELNTLGHALRVWADRSGVQEVYNLSVILVQAERQGADISNSLLEFAASLRVNLRQRADAQAGRAGMWMLFPTLLCMWIPAAAVLVAPLFMELGERREQARKAMRPPGANPNDPLEKSLQPYLQRNNSSSQQMKSNAVPQ